jgi:uncharacterized protein YndB with AHSA1/START domain
MTGPIVRVQRRYGHSAERVFDAFLDPDTLGRFMFRTDTGQLVRCEVDGREGGRFVVTERRGDEDAEHLGEFLELDRPRRMVFRVGMEGWEGEFTQVIIDITPADGGCELTLTHHMSPQWASMKDQVQAGWAGILERLEPALG